MIHLLFRMKSVPRTIAVVLLAAAMAGVFPSAARATEVATGAMLGPSFKGDRFYIRRGGRWEQTYSGGSYRGKARGRLMIVRLPHALFEDEWLTERKFDPDENTDKVIAALDVYAEHGVGAIGVNLQGGDPGYRQEVNGISRNGFAGAGEKNGSLVSAFQTDGSLKQSWLLRLERLLKETDRRGMVVCITYFGRAQDEIFESPQALVAAARNMTDWLIEKNFRNVVIDVAQGWDIEPENWDHGSFIPEYIAHVLEDVRERFHDATFALPIGASSGSNMTYPASLARLCDVVLVLGNGITPDQKRIRLRELHSNLRPIWMIDDDNGSDSGLATLSRETASANVLFVDGAGWGYRPSVQQLFPFAYAPAAGGDLTAVAPGEDIEPTHFKAVLEHIAELVLKKPPHQRKKKR
jgi:hypothetical protein